MRSKSLGIVLFLYLGTEALSTLLCPLHLLNSEWLLDIEVFGPPQCPTVKGNLLIDLLLLISHALEALYKCKCNSSILESVKIYCGKNFSLGFNGFQSISIDDPLLCDKINCEAPEIMVYIHGWASDFKDRRFEHMVKEYFKHRNGSVCAVDWSPLAACDYRTAATKYVPAVAAHVTRFLPQIFDHIPPRNLLLIGHSMGAHMAGVIGRSLGAEQRPGKVYGCDPAGPYWHGNDSTTLGRRLDRSAADCVRQFSTDKGRIGTRYSLGRQNFYYNCDGYSSQPECDGLLSSALECSHFMCTKYIAQTFDSRYSTVARRCGNFEEYLNGKCDAELVPLVDSDWYEWVEK